jgi:hypothetical protein
MFRAVLRLAFCSALALAGAAATGCGAASSPELRVLGVNDLSPQQVVFVQVTNPARQTMRLTKLQYAFEAAGATVSSGELALERDVPAGAAVVVEVPLDHTLAQAPRRPMTLEGKLTAQLDQIVRIFQVSAPIHPH